MNAGACFSTAFNSVLCACGIASSRQPLETEPDSLIEHGCESNPWKRSRSGQAMSTSDSTFRRRNQDVGPGVGGTRIRIQLSMPECVDVDLADEVEPHERSSTTPKRPQRHQMPALSVHQELIANAVVGHDLSLASWLRQRKLIRMFAPSWPVTVNAVPSI